MTLTAEEGCSRGWQKIEAGQIIPAEAVRVLTMTADGSYDLSTFIGCTRRADLEADRNLERISGTNNNCSQPTPANVHVVILDMTSRISFLLQAAQTTRWLEEYGSSPHQQDHLVFHFPRFNVVGLSTHQNLNALFGSCPICSGNIGTLADCPYPQIWQRPDCQAGLPSLFQDLGYITAIATQSWPMDRHFAGFDHVVDFSWLWLPLVRVWIRWGCVNVLD